MHAVNNTISSTIRKTRASTKCSARVLKKLLLECRITATPSGNCCAGWRGSGSFSSPSQAAQEHRRSTVPVPFQESTILGIRKTLRPVIQGPHRPKSRDKQNRAHHVCHLPSTFIFLSRTHAKCFVSLRLESTRPILMSFLVPVRKYCIEPP